MELLVTKLPLESLCVNNCLYVSEEVKLNSDYVKIENSIYRIEHHREIAKDQIALNGELRRMLNVSFKDKVRISWTNIDNYSLREKVVFSITLFGPKKSVVIDKEDFVKMVRDQLKTCVMCEYAIYLVHFCGDRYVCKIMNEGSAGKLSEKTEVEVVSGSPNIKFVQNRVFNQEVNLSELGIGGLSEEFRVMFRRAFAPRFLDKKTLDEMGIKPIRGMLLYGPAGTGKTLLARKIGQILNCREPKIVNGPSLLSKYVGESEANVRALFADAIADKDGSDLHLIICDEFDALGRARGSNRDGTNTSDNIVNQFLSMIDGPESLDNIFLICMTNRRDMIDEALLRPGRLELQIEIGLPDSNGRLEILKIHTDKMLRNSYFDPKINLDEMVERTKNYTGAEIAGLVKAASSYAINRELAFDGSKIKEKFNKPYITSADFDRALTEIKPMFGQASNELSIYLEIPLNGHEHAYSKLTQHISETKGLNNILLVSPAKTGKTVLACHVAKNSEIPFIRMITSERLLKLSNNNAKINHILTTFDDAIRSPQSLIILDNFERLIEWSSVGNHYNNIVLQTIMTMMRKSVPESQKLVVMLICTNLNLLKSFEITPFSDLIIEN